MVALSYLSPSDREVVIDRALVGLSQQQVADRRGVDRKTIGNIERHAHKRLRGLLRNYQAAA